MSYLDRAHLPPDQKLEALKDAFKDGDQEKLHEALKDDDPEVIVIPAVESRHKRIHEKLSRPE